MERSSGAIRQALMPSCLPTAVSRYSCISFKFPCPAYPSGLSRSQGRDEGGHQGNDSAPSPFSRLNGLLQTAAVLPVIEVFLLIALQRGRYLSSRIAQWLPDL
jgi:hypothetical protein